MRPYRLSFALAAVVLVPLVLTNAASAQKVVDKNLEAALRAVLQEPAKELNDELLAKVYVLDAQGKSIRDLSGLEKCKNLAQLRLTKNQVADVKPLAGLSNLQSLDL